MKTASKTKGIEVRKVFDIYEKDPMEIYVDEDRIVLKKCMVACSTCGCDAAENRRKIQV